MKRIQVFSILALLSIMISTPRVSCQDSPAGQDTVKIKTGARVGTDPFKTDSSIIKEKAPLDIADDRGLFIVSHDKQLQLRIMGSIRYLAVFDDKDLGSKNTLNSSEIPTGESNRRFPNYYNGLDQTRFAFEVDRKTTKGDVFVKLEMDFAGSNGLRIRHAYGQYRNFIGGQTWSLFSQVESRPQVIDNVGPTGAITVRNPQIRYSVKNIFNYTTLSLGLEYLTPAFLQESYDSIKASNLLPDITARIDLKLDWAIFQLTGILPILTGENQAEKIVTKAGWGFSFSTKMQLWGSGKLFIQAAGGRGITRYFHDLKSAGYDALINPSNSEAYLPLSFGGYITYEQRWLPNLFSNLSYGYTQLENPSFAPENVFSDGSSIFFHSFYDVAAGARIGIGYAHGLRHDKNQDYGNANRLNLLLYYDF